MKTNILLLSALSFALVGCDNNNSNGTNNVNGSSAAQKTEPTVGEKTTEAVKDAAAKTADALETAAVKTKEVAIDAKDAVAAKLTEWKLTPEDIKADLAKGGRVVRSKAATVAAKSGDVFDNARVVTVINAKLVTDSQLSALKIDVDAADGVVTLKGTVNSVELIGRAITVALDTEGVSQVVSLLTVAM